MSATNKAHTITDRIPAVQKLACSLGYCVDYLAVGLTTGVLWMPFFNIGLGISPTMLGIVLMLLRAWDAVADPIMGSISDNTRTRWGRRRPFIAVGAVLVAVLYLALWHIPSQLGDNTQMVILLLVGILFFTAYTVWSVPYYSLRMELTGYDERTRLAAWVAIAGKFVYLGGGWVMALATCSWFANPDTGKADIVRGMQACSWGIAGLILVFGLLPAFLLKERYYTNVTAHQPRTSFWQNLRESFHCRPLIHLSGIAFFLTLGSSVSNTLGQYVNIYLVNKGRIADASVLNGWKSTCIMIVGLIGIPLWARLSEYLDKKIIVMIMLGCSVTGHLLNVFCLTPEHPYLMLIPAVFETGALGAVWMFGPSMAADVSDYDEVATGRRREGSLSAFSGWFGKLAVTLGAGAGGMLVQSTGFDAAIGEIQPAGVLLHMKWIYIGLPVILWSSTLFFIYRYPLNRGRMSEVRATLEQRRGEV